MDRLPPEFAAMLEGGGEEPQIPPAPEFGMSITEGIPPMGGAEGSMGVDPMAAMGGPPPVDPNAMPMADPNIQSGPPGTEYDQTLATMLANPPKVEIIEDRPRRKKPDVDLIMGIANSLEALYADRNERIVRDIALYRQDISFVPGDFDRRHDTAVVSAKIPNLVNKLANMLSAPEPRIIVPFSDEQSKIASQAQENFGYWCRKLTKKYYSRSGGGNLQWDEFFYLLLHGTLVARVLPDPDDTDYPFYFSLLNPSQCFPYFKGDKHGLDTLVRKYQSKASDIIGTYGNNDPTEERRLQREMGYEPDVTLGDLHEEEGETIEYWDTEYRAVLWRDMVVLPPTRHRLDGVPFVVVSAKGEPKSLSTPVSARSSYLDEYGNTGYGPGRGEDMAQKAVSVFHHLVHTNKLLEITHTLHLMEVEKALNPPTITYVAPQYQGEDPGPLNLRKRGNNRRILNFHRVEAVPTSPRPTDVAPLLNTAMSDFAEGSLPAVAHGNESGSNVSGFAVESLIAVAKDATLPYTAAWETYLAQVLELKLKHYKKFILPVRTISVPQRRTYGSTPMMELTRDVMEASGIDVEVKLWAMSQQMLPGQINAAAMAVQAGFWSIRKAMEHTGSLDPDKDFQDIISERAIQHPEIMENFLIPQSFMARGQDNLAELWSMFVLMPKMQAMMGAGMPMPGGGGPPQIPGGGAAPESNGQSNPTMGDNARSTGGGPSAGAGRGPAPQ
jgi:hypothetical protein